MNEIEYPTGPERRVTLAAIFIVFLLSALDQTVVATAMPRIVAELSGLALYSWVTTAYLLSSTVMVPIWGKLGDLYGRKPMLIWSISIFLAGSWLSGLSGEFGDLPMLGGGMTQLVAFRALQGIGGGGLMTTAFAIVGELYPPRERAKVSGFLGSVFGVSSAIGPLVGGFLTDHGTVIVSGITIAGWRWVFYVNLPLSLISLFMILARMPSFSRRNSGKIDFLGAALIVAAVVPFLLALTHGGRNHAWTSPGILGLFAISAAALVAYTVAERYASNPIVPMSLFRNRVFTTANLSAFLMSMSFMSTTTFLPLFMQAAQGIKATSSGLAILPCMIGIIIGSLTSGNLAARSGQYKPYLLGGVVMTLTGILLLSRITTETSRIDLAIRMFIMGLGLGPCQGLFNLAIQNALPHGELGVATSSGQFFRQIGATVGVAMYGTIVSSRLSENLGNLMPGATLETLQTSGHAGQLLPLPVRELIASAITHCFGLGLFTIGAALIVAVLMPQVELRGSTNRVRQPAKDEDAAVLAPAEVHL